MTTLEQLIAERAAMPDPFDLSPRQYPDFEAKRSALDGRINTSRHSATTLAEVDPLIAMYTKWRDHLVAWRKTLSEQLATCPPIKQQSLKLSIQRIDWGLDLMGQALPASLPLDVLMAEAGYVPRDQVARANGDAWLGTLPEVEERLKRLQQRHDDATARLNDALLDDEDRARRQQERAAMTNTKLEEVVAVSGGGGHEVQVGSPASPVE